MHPCPPKAVHVWPHCHMPGVLRSRQGRCCAACWKGPGIATCCDDAIAIMRVMWNIEIFPQHPGDATTYIVVHLSPQQGSGHAIRPPLERAAASQREPPHAAKLLFPSMYFMHRLRMSARDSAAHPHVDLVVNCDVLPLLGASFPGASAGAALESSVAHVRAESHHSTECVRLFGRSWAGVGPCAATMNTLQHVFRTKLGCRVRRRNGDSFRTILDQAWAGRHR